MSSSSTKDLIDTAAALDALIEQHSSTKLMRMFPDEGPYSRQYYKKHIEFFKAGAAYKERALIGGNRVGKSETGSYELACHLTGMYPEWWEGRRFDGSINAIAAGKTNATTRDIVQKKLLGSLMKDEFGTGMIPKSCLVRTTARAGIADGIQDIYVKHSTGGTSHVTIHSYEQGRGAFEGVEAHVIWFDEEPDDQELYTEALMRTVTTKGIMFSTFTPLYGISDIVLAFLPGGKLPDNNSVGNTKWAIQVQQDEVPEEQIPTEEREAFKDLPPHIKEARTKGIPSVGAGKIYPISEDDIVVEPFTIPRDWPKAYGADPGWGKFAAVWGAVDPNTGVIYLYDEYYRGQTEPASHAASIRARGSWMYGAMDFAGQSQGKTMLQQYSELGLNVVAADKEVDAGILAVYRAMCEGRLKVFNTLGNWIKEFRIYRYNSKTGKVHKEFDHLMDSTRYLVKTGINLAEKQPDFDDLEFYKHTPDRSRGVSEITGY